MHQWHQAPSRGRYVGTTILRIVPKANITDDQGLIELLSHFDYFRQASQHSKITILLDHGYHPDTLQKALQALYPQVMSKIRFQLAPKPTKAERAAQGKTGFVPWRHDGSLNGRMLGWRDVRVSQNFERTLSHATAKVNLCFVRLMLKRCPMIEIPNGFYRLTRGNTV